MSDRDHKDSIIEALKVSQLDLRAKNARLQEQLEEAKKALADTQRNVIEPLKMQRNSAEHKRDRYKARDKLRVKILKAVPSTEVGHIIQPRIEAWLKDYDYVVVAPSMGLSQFEKFGERIIVDCHDYISHQPGFEEDIRRLAMKYGLSTIDNPCAAIDLKPEQAREKEER